MIEKTNAKQHAQVFLCRHMQPGICGYKDEKVLLDTDSMLRAASSMVGKPVFVNHKPGISVDDIEEHADGYVTRCFFNELDGWLWAEFVVFSDEGLRAVERKWSVSNAYIPQVWEDKGSHLNVDYDRKFTEYAFTHLAIVANPRYENAEIFTPESFKAYQAEQRAKLEFQNSKPTEGHPIMKFFQKKTEELTNGIPADADLSQIEMEVDGKRVPLSEIVNSVAEAEKKAKDDLEKENAGKRMKMNDDTMVTVGDEKMPLGELMNKYNSMSKCNSEEEEKKAKEKEEKEKENAEKEAEDKKKAEDEKEKENSKFSEIMNAINSAAGKSAPVSVGIETSRDKVIRGKQRYGSVKK